jgi:hypothetical protein
MGVVNAHHKLQVGLAHPRAERVKYLYVAVWCIDITYIPMANQHYMMIKLDTIM